MSIHNFINFSDSPAISATFCCNCAKNGKGGKFGTNEADTIEIKNLLGGHFKNFKIFVEFQYGRVTQRHDHRAKATDKNIVVVPSNPEKTIIRLFQNDP